MNQKSELSIHNIDTINKLAKNMRFRLGFSEEPPIANDIFTILDKLEIILLEFPIEFENSQPKFSAVILCSEEGGENLVFIGLNTADYFDNQIFSIAHELYHFFNKSNLHFSRQNENKNELIEIKANRFAAEFLLPENVLRNHIYEEFLTYSLKTIKTKVILRFIARLHCIFWLPYKSLVKRLREVDAISKEQYQELYKIDERHAEGEYGKIGRSTQNDVFSKLNSITRSIGSSPKAIEVILRNFENGLIDEDQFVSILNLFDKDPNDYGYEIAISQDDIDEFNNFFEGWDNGN